MISFMISVVPPKMGSKPGRRTTRLIGIPLTQVIDVFSTTFT